MKIYLNKNDGKQLESLASLVTTPRTGQSRSTLETQAAQGLKIFEFDQTLKPNLTLNVSNYQPTSLYSETRALLSKRRSLLKSPEMTTSEFIVQSNTGNTSEKRSHQMISSHLNKLKLTTEIQLSKQIRGDHFNPSTFGLISSPRSINQDQEKILSNFLLKRNSTTQVSGMLSEKMRNIEDLTLSVQVTANNNLYFHKKLPSKSVYSKTMSEHPSPRAQQVQIQQSRVIIDQPTVQSIRRPIDFNDIMTTYKMTKEKLVRDRQELSRGRKKEDSHFLSRKHSLDDNSITTRTVLSGDTLSKTKLTQKQRSPENSNKLMKGLSLQRKGTFLQSAYNITSLDPTQHISSQEINFLWSQIEVEEQLKQPAVSQTKNQISMIELSGSKPKLMNQSSKIGEKNELFKQHENIIEVSSKLIQRGMVSREELTALLDKKISISKYFMRTDIDEPSKIQTFKRLLNVFDNSKSTHQKENHESAEITHMLTSLQPFFFSGKTLPISRGNSIILPDTSKQDIISSLQKSKVFPSSSFQRVKQAQDQRAATDRSQIQIQKSKPNQKLIRINEAAPASQDKLKALVYISNHSVKNYKL